MHTRGANKFFINALLLLLIANIVYAESPESHTPARLLAKQTGATQYEEERYETHTDCNDHKHHLKKRSSDEDVDYEVYQGVVGRPGIDFPIYPRIPKTSFSCRTIGNGYFADMETDCQVFHICEDGRKISFLCPNGTIFQQSELTCDWWFKVNCLGSQGYYADSAEILSKQRVQRVRPSIPVQGFNIVGGASSIGLNFRPKLTSSAPRSRHSNKSDRRMDSNEEQPSLESVDFEDISGEKQLKGQQKKLISNIENNSNDNESQIAAESASFVGNKRRNNFNYEKPEAEVEQKPNSDSRKNVKGGSRRGSNDRGSQRHGNSKYNDHRNEPYSQKTRNGHRGQQRFQEERKRLAESYESEEQSKQQASPEKIIQTLVSPAHVSPKFNNRVDITSEADIFPNGEEFQVIESSSKTKNTQATTSSYNVGTYSTARRLDSTRTTPFYTPTVPTVVKSKTTEGKSFYIKGSLASTTPNSTRFNAGLPSSLVLESSSGPKSSTASKTSTLATAEQLDFNPIIGSTQHLPFNTGNRHHQKEKPSEIHRISVSANSHFNADLPLNKADSDSGELLSTTTAAPSTGPTYLPKSASVPSKSDDDAGGDSLLFAPSVVKDESVNRNVNEMLKTMNLLKKTIGANKLYDVEEIKFQGKVREGLEIPPSSGPDALVSLAKYFAGEQNDSATSSLNAVGNAEKPRKSENISPATANGVSGSSGLNGASGSSGSNGASGSSGLNGASGSNGSNRFNGSGSNGASGTSGSNGVRGSSGLNGSSGTSGSNGVRGSSGLNGASGSNGTGGNGAGGSSGLNGASKAIGSNGVSGSSGLHGASGSSGSNGARGSSGLNGSSGSNSANGLNGASGTSGSNGVRGSSGSHGTNGSNGKRGSSGSSGINGASGSNGAGGLNGASGSSGLNGANGSSGSSRLNGASGSSSLSGPSASTTASKGTVSTSTISKSASPIIGVKSIGIKGSLLSENTLNQYSNLFGLKPVKGKQQSPTSSEVFQSKEKTTISKEPQSNNIARGSFPTIASTDATIRNLAEKPESRKIAQVFSNALTTYLEDPKSFREQLASARPTEPPLRSLSKFSERITTEATPINTATATVYLPTRQTPEIKTTTPATRTLAVEINKKFEHSTQVPDFTASTTEVYDYTTLKPFGDSSEQNHKLELSAELYPPSPDSGEGEEFFQREQTQSFVNSRNQLHNAQNKLEKKPKDSPKNTGYTTNPTPTPTKNPWNHISQNDFLDPLTINDGLMKEQRTTTGSPFTYLPKETTTEVITTAKVPTGRQEILSDYTQRLHHGSGVKALGRSSGQFRHSVDSDSWHDIFNNYDLPLETLPSSSGLQRIANKLFGGLNESEALHLKNVMQQAEHNRQVLSLLLLLIQTCDDQNGKALERSRKHLLNALIDMDGKFTEGKTSHQKAETKKIKNKIGTTTSRVPVTTYRRDSEDIITSTLPYSSTTTDWPSTTVRSSTLITGSVEETTKFEIRVEDFDDDSAGLYTTVATNHGTTSSKSDKRALELLKSLYSLASKFTSRR